MGGELLPIAMIDGEKKNARDTIFRNEYRPNSNVASNTSESKINRQSLTIYLRILV